MTNSAHWISEIGTRLACECDIAAIWYWDHSSKRAKVSLRSFHDFVDCGSFAKLYGGGGHANIAGFEFDKNIEELFNDDIRDNLQSNEQVESESLSGSDDEKESAS